MVLICKVYLLSKRVLKYPRNHDTKSLKKSDNKIVISFFNCSIQPISVVLDASESCQMVNFNIGGSTSTTRKWDIKGAEYLFFSPLVPSK